MLMRNMYNVYTFIIFYSGNLDGFELHGNHNENLEHNLMKKHKYTVNYICSNIRFRNIKNLNCRNSVNINN